MLMLNKYLLNTIILLLIFTVVHGVDDFRANVEGPIVIDFQFFQYFCNLLDFRRPPSSSQFQVTFLFDFLEDTRVPRIAVSSSNDRASVDQTYLMDKMDQQITCRAESIPSGSELVISSNYISIGIERMFTRSLRDSKPYYACDSCVFESDKDPLVLTFKATVPFRCSDSGLYTRCVVNANVTTTRNLVVRESTSQNPCVVFFTFSDFFNLYTSNLSIYAVKDEFTSGKPRANSVTLAFPSFQNFTLNGTTYQDNWSNYVTKTDIRHIDDPRAFCTVSGVSQVKTFDGFNYLVRGIGQFVYVTTGGLTPFEVQLRHWPCSLDSLRSCVCGVAVQELTTDVIMDMCLDGTPHFISHSCLDFPTKTGIKVIANPERNRFAILFPSGNRIYASIVGRELSLDIYVNSDKLSLLSGLCGSFDNNSINDLQMVNDLEKWRLPIGASIFDGRLAPVPSSSLPPLTTSGDSFCSCNNGVPSCNYGSNNFGLTEQLRYGMTDDIQPVVPSAFTSCPRLDYYYDSRKYLYYKWMNATYDLRWPTASGILEDVAGNYCRSVLWDLSPISGVCAALTNQDLSHVLDRCKIEIQIWGTLDSATNIEPELGRLCLAKGAATELQEGLAGLGVLRNISDAFCESFTCNFRGSCQNGICKCAAGVSSTSIDCSYLQNSSPSIFSKFNGRMCDVRTEDCTQLLLYTKNIRSIFPRCHFAMKKAFFGPVNLPNNTYLGSRVDENRTMCYPRQDYLDIVSYPDNHRISRVTRGSPLLFDLSVGNDGVSFSAPSPILLFDSYCYNCTDFPDFACGLKILDGQTCLINGYCIKNGTLKTADPGFYCNVDLNPKDWIPINTMPTTTAPTPANLLADYLTKLANFPDPEIPPGNMVDLANRLTSKYLDPNPLCINILDNAKSIPAITPIVGANLVTNLEYFLYAYCQKNDIFQEVAANMAADITGVRSTIETSTQAAKFGDLTTSMITIGTSSSTKATVLSSSSVSRDTMIIAIVIGTLASFILLALLATLCCCFWGSTILPSLTPSWMIPGPSTPCGKSVPGSDCSLGTATRCIPKWVGPNPGCTTNNNVYPGGLYGRRIFLRFRNGIP